MGIKSRIDFKKNQLRILLPFAAMILSCTRPLADNSAKVTLTLPEASSQSSYQANSNLVSAQSTTYGVSTPTAFSSLNCFFAFVSGPDQGMSNSVCAVGNANIPVGAVVGGLASGTTVTVDVPSGASRVISLVGIQTDGTISCPNLNNFDSLSAHFSNPVLVGTSSPQNLASGATVSISIPVTAVISSSTQTIGNCTGPAFNNGGGGGGGNGGIPAGYSITSLDNGANYIAGSCVPMQLRIVDGGGGGGGGGANVNGTFNATLNGTNGVLLSNNQNCSSATASLGMIFTGYNTQSFYALVPTSGNSFQYNVTGSAGPTTLPNGTIPRTFTSVTDPGGPYSIALVDAFNLLTVGLSPAATAPTYVCRPYLVQVQDTMHRPVAGAIAGVSANNLTATASYWQFYPDQFCSTSGTGNAFSFTTNAPLTNAPVYATTTIAAMNATVAFTPSMPGSTPTISSGFSFNTITGPGTATKIGLVSVSNPNFGGSNVLSIKRPGSGCVYGAEIGYFDASGVRALVPGTGGFAFSGITTGVLFNYNSSSPSFDIGGSGSPISGVSAGSSVTAYKVPLFVCSSSPLGSYSMSVVGTGSLTSLGPTTMNFTVDP